MIGGDRADERTTVGVPSTDAPSDPPVSGRILSRITGLVVTVEQTRETLLGAPADPGVALHDFRVALRRLRSAMRPLGILTGRRRALELSAKLRDVAALTGDLRDEEVLRESLTDLELAPKSEGALVTWMLGRARRERGARERVLRALQADARRGDGLGAILAAIRRRISKGGMATGDHAPPTDVDAARTAVQWTMDRVRARAAIVSAASPSSPEAPEQMHRLRISIKGLRYTAELVEGVVDRPLIGVDHAAAKLQRHLGKVHDLDEAKIRMQRAWGLERDARAEVITQLGRRRAKLLVRLAREIPEELARIEQGIAGP